MTEEGSKAHIEETVVPEVGTEPTTGVVPHRWDRATAWVLLNQHTQSSSLLKHALAVETCVRAYGERLAVELDLEAGEARKLVEIYAIAGLLHDFDYEKHPSREEHPFVGNRILTEQGWPEEIRHAILAHAEYSGTPRVSHLDKTLFACDELAGLLTAISLVKPSKSIFDVDVHSVRKKMKDKAFARGVNREDILIGARELGVDLDQHIASCIAAMRNNAAALGLAGQRVEG
ncbi:MAG TPA: HD domain-containing protein [Acidobacteriaceae bacterium]|nr:HD domain-containing protein [Acidobacteriaceae bacterium]